MSMKKDKTRTPKRNVLGMGLDALLPEGGPEGADASTYFQCDIDDIRPNRYQPRRHFAPDELAELADSIREQGVIQPLVIRETENGYELIAGERRLRAARQAGLSTVPVVVVDVPEDRILIWTMVENIQRENLNPLEESEGYHQLVSKFGLTQEQVAERVGRKRSTVANFLRLRNLPRTIQDAIGAGELSMGHARALLGLENPALLMTAFKTVIGKNLSVRATEDLVNRLRQAPKKPEPEPEKTPEQIHFDHLCEELSRDLGTKVAIDRRGKRGVVRIEFYSDDDLTRLVDRLKSAFVS